MTIKVEKTKIETNKSFSFPWVQIDVLQAEVAALKTLVLSSPTSPCMEMPPGPKAPFKKGHARNKSTSSAMMGSQQEVAVTQPIVRECKEVCICLCTFVCVGTLSHPETFPIYLWALFHVNHDDLLITSISLYFYLLN